MMAITTNSSISVKAGNGRVARSGVDVFMTIPGFNVYAGVKRQRVWAWSENRPRMPQESTVRLSAQSRGQGEFKNGSRRRKEADFGANNTSASMAKHRTSNIQHPTSNHPTIQPSVWL